MTALHRLKRRRGFFAAGAEFTRALDVLGNGAFKLFAHVCLEADRATARLAFDRGELAGQLGKSRSALGATCANWPAPASTSLRPLLTSTATPCWPCRRTTGPAGVGIRGPGPADARLAGGWHARSVPLETVRHAILLGCVRKSMALIERPATQPVRRLCYFESSLREVQRESFPATHWRHLEFNLGRCEDYWQRDREAALGCAWSKMEQAAQCADLVTDTPVVRAQDRKDETVMPTSSLSGRDPIDGGANELSS